MVSGTVVISLTGSGHELLHLAGWLRGEDDLRPGVTMDEDSIEVVVNSGSVATLCTSVFDWLGHRREIDSVSLSMRAEKA
ncbi:hypothetical protein SAMN05421504_1021092 [Amycolatopsis xylanica]|uniref:Uncharacterized protein n=1 Tax=Amycolatopsis xylanica TaxID=589385 RepID=A0A1H3AXS1_9PSEU|nr:hypothetical protein SAMN05421504_1021092 [Amycolatopsis xylanica]